MTYHGIEISGKAIVDFCKRNHIRRLALFGSILREDFSAKSDIDVLVEFEPAHIPGLSFFTMEMELSEIIGHKVELHTPQFLSSYFREKVMNEMEILYVAA